MVDHTSIQLTTTTRDRLFKAKERKSYNEYVNDLIDIAEKIP